MVKKQCIDCGNDYKVIGLDIFEKCPECLDKLINE